MVQDGKQPELRDNLLLELRRGALVFAVLAQLRVEQYGYELKKTLADCGLNIDEGTLYPLMRRLESQGLLESEWRLEGSRPRRYYRISKAGSAMLESLADEWDSLTQAIRKAVKVRCTTQTR